ncbi:MAG: Nicotinamidase [Syntrophus sp. SKADARSKE-3]|nr:Nicotinamidase [Syntrophus sp. SKADARSKE-3]
MRNCLIITDVQNDFCPGGALAVTDGDAVIPIINKIAPSFDKVVATQDWHPSGHVSFASTHNKTPYEIIEAGGIKQVLWPDHCVPGTFGADFHKDLDTRVVDLIIRKGKNPKIDSYSTFLENDKKTETGLKYYLSGLHIDHLFFCGLATDYCVYYSALDALALAFQVTVIIDACRGVDIPAGNIDSAIGDMKKKGIRVESHETLL